MSDADFIKHSMVPPSGGNGAPPQIPFEPSNEDNQPTISPRLTLAVQIISILVITVSIAFILKDTVFTINNVAVVGNTNIPNEIILSSAGINSPNYFNINEEEIAKNIDINRYLKYLSMEKRFPNGLTIYVKERIPAACINYIGIMYILADDGVVLEKLQSAAILQVDWYPLQGLIYRTFVLVVYPRLEKLTSLQAA